MPSQQDRQAILTQLCWAQHRIGGQWPVPRATVDNLRADAAAHLLHEHNAREASRTGHWWSIYRWRVVQLPLD